MNYEQYESGTALESPVETAVRTDLDLTHWRSNIPGPFRPPEEIRSLAEYEAAAPEFETFASEGALEWSGESPPTDEFSPADTPKPVTDALAKRDWQGALKLAIEAGLTDQNELTNLLFFARHPDLPRERIDPKRPDFKKLATEWSRILLAEVRPAVYKASENTELKVSGKYVAERDPQFSGINGKKFKEVVEWAAKEADINPGFLAACLLAEWDRSSLYLSETEVRSFVTGTDDFFASSAQLRANVPAYAKVRFDAKRKSTNVNEQGRTVTTVPFKTGRDAALATAVYLKWGEIKLRRAGEKNGFDFDKLSAATKLALVRIGMAAGHGGIKPDGTLVRFRKQAGKWVRAKPGEGGVLFGVASRVGRVMKGQDILVRKPEPRRFPSTGHITNRNATILAAQALHLSKWFFEIPLDSGPTQQEMEAFPSFGEVSYEPDSEFTAFAQSPPSYEDEAEFESEAEGPGFDGRDAAELLLVEGLDTDAFGREEEIDSGFDEEDAPFGEQVAPLEEAESLLPMAQGVFAEGEWGESEFALEEAEHPVREQEHEPWATPGGQALERSFQTELHGPSRLSLEDFAEFESAPPVEYQAASSPRPVQVTAVWRRPPFPAGLKTGILARSKARVQTRELFDWFVSRNRPAIWLRRLDADLVQLVPEVDVTFEVFKQLKPLNHGDLFTSIRRYVELRHLTDLKKTPFWSAHIYSLRAARLGQRLNVDLGPLINAARLRGLPPGKVDDYFVVAYVSFPASLESSMAPEQKFVVDEFQFGKHGILPAHATELERTAKAIIDAESTTSPIRTIRLMGHTDPVGSDRSNVDLGGLRALAVQRELIRLLEEKKPRLYQEIAFFVESLGETRPVADNRTEAGRARNRRVEGFISKLGSGPDVTGGPARVSIQSVAERGLELLRNPSGITQGEADRLSCVLRKVLSPDVDDRYVDAQLILSVYSTGRPRPEFYHMKDALTMKSGFGPDVDDSAFVKGLQYLESSIMSALDKVNQLKAQQGSAVSNGILGIGNWMVERMKDDRSVLSCYSNI